MANRILWKSLSRRTFLKAAAAALSALAIPGKLFDQALASNHELPLILIGPILRRVEPGSVSVFLATSQPTSIELLLFEGFVDAANASDPHATQTTHTTMFGAQFHAAVVTVTLDGNDALQAGTRYSYDIRTTPDGSTVAQSLLDLKLLEDLPPLPGYGTQAPENAPVEVNSLGYGQGQLPSFVTCPATLDALVLAHASCRKPHGAGHPALWHLDTYLGNLSNNNPPRPTEDWLHMLFLTGDQIYADDVATALLPGLSDLGISLISGPGTDRGVEEMPRPAGSPDPPDNGNPNLAVTTTVLPAGFRQKLLYGAGFTSREAESHLVGFGEFLAMYCIAWNPHLWPVLAKAEITNPNPNNPDDVSEKFAKLRDKLQADAARSPDQAQSALGRGLPSPDAATDVITPLYNGSDPASQKLLAIGKQFLVDKARLDAFRREVPKVRRLLANVPTYMIADDHEITDDWFMTRHIRDETLGDPFGQALTRNAMAAYTVCQGWGNDPIAWGPETAGGNAIQAIAAMFGEGWSGGLPNNSATVDTALGLQPGAEPNFDFSFTVAGPVHQVRALDTRTRRQYDGPRAVPGLMNEDALERQMPIEPVLDDGHVLIVMSPSPVFGPWVISEIGGPLRASIHDIQAIENADDLTKEDREVEAEVSGLAEGQLTGKIIFDAEHWGAHPESFERLLERMSHFSRVVVLGGDVHYGAAYAMDWTNRERTSRIVHFTASSARNEWTGGGPGLVRNLLVFNGMANGLQKIGLPMTRLGWWETSPDFEPVVAGDIGSEPPQTQFALLTSPVLLSDELFRERHDLDPDRPPEWAWRAAPILDQRPFEQRPEETRVTLPAEDLPEETQGSEALDRYGEVAAVHAEALDRAVLGRGLQFLNNVGIIRFATTDGQISVSQSLYSLRERPDETETGDAYIVHEALLERDPIAFPSRIGPGE